MGVNGVSIVIATKGRVKLLGNLLESLVEPRKNYSGPTEVLLIDDSSENEQKEIDVYCDMYDARRIFLVHLYQVKGTMERNRLDMRLYCSWILTVLQHRISLNSTRNYIAVKKSELLRDHLNSPGMRTGSGSQLKTRLIQYVLKCLIGMILLFGERLRIFQSEKAHLKR